MPILSENSPLIGLQYDGDHREEQHHQQHQHASSEPRKNMMWALFLTAACVIAVYTLRSSSISTPTYLREEYNELSSSAEKIMSSKLLDSKSKSKYTKVQTLSFQIYTGGAPAFTTNATTGKTHRNHECKGLHSYGLPEDSDEMQCYLGLEDSTEDVQKRLDIMVNAVDRAYDVSVKEDDVLKIFLAPEFYFRGLNGAYDFGTEEEEDEEGYCSDICHILKGLENIVANKRFEDWLFLFGTVIASETLPVEDTFDYQFYNFAPLYKGYDPAESKRIGKRFIVPKRYVSNIDFLTPYRDLTLDTNVMELLDDEKDYLDQTLLNPHANGIKRYGNDIWATYKDELTGLGYNMIEYGWFFMDGIAFSVEICLDHLSHRALQTFLADLVTGSHTRIPSSNNDSIEWVGIPKHQAQISLVSSAGMDVTVESLALANGGHIFLQDGMEGNAKVEMTYGTDECKPNEWEFFGGSQCIQRTAIIEATDVTFEYEMNMNFKDYNLYSGNKWKAAIKGVFSTTAYQPRLTVYDPVNITLT